MSIVQLNFWLMPNGDFDTLNALEKEISHFEKWHTNIHIEPTIVPWSHVWDRLMNAYKHHGELVLPDVIQVGTTWVPTLSYLGVLKDVSSFFEDHLTSDIIKPLQESCRSPETGGWMCYPWIADIRMLFYRIDILRMFGFSSKDLETFDSFKKVCLEIQKKRKTEEDVWAYRLSGSSELVQIHDLAPWIWSMGGDFLTEDFKRVAFDGPQARKAIHWYFDQLRDLYSGRDALYGIIPNGSFFSGKYAMEIIGKYPFNNISYFKHTGYKKEVAENYGIVPIPRGAEGQYSFIGGSGLAIPKWCRYPEEAAEWIRFLVSPESQLRHNFRIGVFPSRISLLEDFLKKNKEDLEMIQSTLSMSKTLPYTPLLGTLERIIHSFTERVLKSVRVGEYSGEFLDREIDQAAVEANYIFSMYSQD
jgi:multiple sugar transport system substrate-binding protein